MKEISAGGVVYRNRAGTLEILLIQDRYGFFTLPKGKQESGETIEQTALREIQEETGITGLICDKIKTVRYQYVHEEKGIVDKEVTYFLVKASDGETTPQLEEIRSANWYELSEAFRLQQERGYENNQDVLKQAIEMIQRQEAGKMTQNIAQMIDHTLLKPEATEEQIVRLCEEAKTYGFASVCVNPYWVKKAAELLKDSPVKVCTVIGFPLGATTKETKVFETRQAVENGADEVDMVMNIGAFKSGLDDVVREEIRAVVEAAQGKLVKVILETGLLSEEEIKRASLISKEAGAHFVKTSTGFGAGGATVEAVRIMRQTVGKDMGVKASGGIRDAKTAQAMIEAGANRIGASSSIAIVTGKTGTSAY
jgi:deoxyribose-phosphate aldolase